MNKSLPRGVSVPWFRVLGIIAFLFICCSWVGKASAVTLDITLDEVNSQLQDAIANKTGFQQLLAQKIEEKLNEGNLSFTDGKAVIDLNIPTFDSNTCTNRTRIVYQNVKVTLTKDMSFHVNVSNINSPFDIGTHFHAIVTGKVLYDNWTGGINTWWLHWCHITHRSATITLTDTEIMTDLNLHADLTSNLTGNTISVDVVSELTNTNFDYNVGHPTYTYSSVLVSLGDLLGLIDPAKYVNDIIEKGIVSVYDAIEAQKPIIKAQLDGNYQYVLPDMADVTLLAEAVKAEPYLRQLIYDNRYEILYDLAINDQAALNTLLSNTTACASASLLLAQMPHVPVYYLASNGMCEQADPNGADAGTYYSDSNCVTELAYTPTKYSDFCTESLDLEAKLGNAASWTPVSNQANDPLPNIPSSKWTMYPGTAMAVTAESLSGKDQPYMKRVRYKTINNVTNPDGTVRGSGTCELEMRIYKKDPTASNQHAVLDIHGGGWSGRGPYAGLEAEVAQLTERGYVVFAPFYRLADTVDGNIECNNATAPDIESDVNDALDWVLQNGAAMGADLQRGVDVTGQSAGAHLSLWLITHRSNVIHKGILLYPPSDVSDFVQKAVVGGEYENWMNRIPMLQKFFGVPDLAQIPYQDLMDNSFYSMIDPASTPPVYILQGTADSWVPSQQAVGLCNAYGGNAVNDGGDPLLGVYRTVYNCGSSGGQLHMFGGAMHSLDLSCMPGIACPSGSVESSMAIAESLGLARDWMLVD